MTAPARPTADPSADPADVAAAPAGNPLAPPVPRLMVRRVEAAAALGMSVDTLDRLRDAGKLPASLKVAGRVLYRVADLERWVALGCPDRKTFDALAPESPARPAKPNGRPRPSC